MDFLHAKYLKIVAAGGDLSAAPEKKFTKEVASLKVERKLAESFVSETSQPIRRAEVGTDFNLKGVLEQADLDDLVFLIGGVHTTGTFTKTQTVAALPKYDIEVGVYRPSDGAIVPWTLTNVNFVQAVEFKFEHAKWSYMPVEAMGTSESSLTIDNT